MHKTIALALLLGAFSFAPVVAVADAGGHDLEQLVVEMADTPADHAALAKHYRAKAADARATASRHENMARVYTGGKFMQREGMRSHCSKIAANYTAVAAEYEALAKLHDEESKKAK